MRTLVGKKPSRELFERAARVAFARATPLSQNEYKVEVGRNVLVEALMENEELDEKGITDLIGPSVHANAETNGRAASKSAVR